MLIREDYRALYDLLYSSPLKMHEVVAVTGQPGIGALFAHIVTRSYLLPGKTYFLWYCLLRRLCARLPTLVYTASWVLYFSNQPTLRIHKSDLRRYKWDLPRDTWVLIDLDLVDDPVPDVFTNPSANLRLILCVSPPVKRYYSLMKQMDGAEIFMQPWTIFEMIAGLLAYLSFFEADKF